MDLNRLKAYKTNIPEMDTEDLVQANLMEDLEKCIINNLPTKCVLIRIEQSIIKHFASEERFMERMGFPYRKIHKRRHKELVHDFSALTHLHDENHQITDMDTVEKMFNLFLEHIVNYDSQYVDYMRSKGN